MMMWIFPLGLLYLTDAVPLGVHQVQESAEGSQQTTLPDPNGRLNLYVLPVGQGDAQLIQCPSGELSFFDLGTSDASSKRFWHEDEIKAYLGDSISDVKNIFLSHNHRDHYSLMDNVFDQKYGLENFYVSCVADDLPSAVGDWLAAIEGYELVRTFNGGEACGPNGIACDEIDICPNDPAVFSKIMTANLGQHCTDGGNKNIDSLVLKLTHGDVSILYTGDFEDETTSVNENGPQKLMADYYGDELQVTVYHIAHHGASSLANKPVWRNALRPKATFVSSNPWYSSYRHPRCLVKDGFLDEVQTVCKPEVTDSEDPFYCGDRVTGDEDVLQPHYTCGGASGGHEERADNEFAMYTSVPDDESMNYISFTTDGSGWQFSVNTLAQFRRGEYWLDDDVEED